jgi:hypothetical protein
VPPLVTLIVMRPQEEVSKDERRETIFLSPTRAFLFALTDSSWMPAAVVIRFTLGAGGEVGMHDQGAID